ncbi:MAG: radical SAM protein [Planctomycetes bacterium]|nr:radical SAM protein [Planctomycetota bacterium]
MKKLATATGKEKQVELSPIHDFASKLRQPGILERLQDYVRWQVEWRAARTKGVPIEDLFSKLPDQAPLSINLDVTTSCNYACDHCVDFEILNKNIRYDHEKLLTSLTNMHSKGLRSVILIGGGEPTVYPQFTDIVRHLKAMGIKIGVVTNGSRLDRILEVADLFEPEDWVRLSLDSGTNETFRAMHKPKQKKVTLEWICEAVPPIKAKNPNFNIGFSFIIVWNDCEANEAEIHENVDEIVIAAKLAKDHKFDYISFKPFLSRAERNNAEIVGLTQEEERVDPVMSKIRTEVNKAKVHHGDGFRVIESTNLKVLENGSYMDYTDQPRNCHMQFFRQVLSPLGLFNCPVYRHVKQAEVSDKNAYATLEETRKTQESTLRLIETFDAREECKEVTCLYNHVNWYIEGLIDHPERLEEMELAPDRKDYFL